MIQISDTQVQIAKRICNHFCKDFPSQTALEMIAVMNAHACIQLAKQDNEFGLMREHFKVSTEVLKALLDAGVKT